MIKGIIFDFGQTLVDSSRGFKVAEKQVQKNIYSDLNLTLWEDFIYNYRRIRKSCKGDFNFSRRSMWKKIYTLYRSKWDEELLITWEHQYWEKVKYFTKPFPETVHTLAKLNEKYILAVITNTQGQVISDSHRIADFPDFERIFKTIIIAGEPGIPPKPDPMPFRICLEKLGLRKEQVVFVGDDWHIDIVGSMRAGLNAVWLKHHLVKRNWPEVNQSVPVITSIDQLPDLPIMQ